MSLLFKATPKNLLESTGFQKCKLEVHERIRARQYEISMLVKKLAHESENTKSLIQKQKNLSEFSKLSGELDGLERLWKEIHSLRFQDGSSQQ